MAEVAALKGAEPELKAAQDEADKALADRLAAIPNRPKADVPEGADEHGNVALPQPCLDPRAAHRGPRSISISARPPA